MESATGGGFAAFVGEGDFLVGDECRPSELREGLGGEGDETGAGERVEENVEELAVLGGSGAAQGALGERGEELAGRAGGRVGEGGEDGAEVARLCAVVGAAKDCAVVVAGEQKSQRPQGRRASAASPKWRMMAVMRHCWVSANATMRSIWERRKAIWVS